MRKLMIPLIVAACFAAGCAAASGARVVRNDQAWVKHYNPYGVDLVVWQDPLTGCHWFTSEYVGMLPRINANGQQVCSPPGSISQ